MVTRIINQLNTVEQTPDVVVDFSGVAAFEAVVGFVRERGCALVSGHNGLLARAAFRAGSSWGRACR